METLNIMMDFVLIGAAIWMLLSIREVGGLVGQGLTLVTVGAVILGLAHLLETALIELVGMEIVAVELIHRASVLVGFVLMALGFNQFRTLG